MARQKLDTLMDNGEMFVSVRSLREFVNSSPYIGDCDADDLMGDLEHQLHLQATVYNDFPPQRVRPIAHRRVSKVERFLRFIGMA